MATWLHLSKRIFGVNVGVSERIAPRAPRRPITTVPACRDALAGLVDALDGSDRDVLARAVVAANRALGRTQ